MHCVNVFLLPLNAVDFFYLLTVCKMFHVYCRHCAGVLRPQQLSAVTSGIAFHPLSASLAAAAATRPGFYFAAQPSAAMPGLATSASIIPATSLAGVGNAGAREAGMMHC